MRHFYRFALGLSLAASVALSSCSTSSAESDSTGDAEGSLSTDGYADGTYCAAVSYYYSPTGTNSTYTLLVDVEDNNLVRIHWPNGGWLDDTHYSGPDIEDGDARFTSDIGADYIVRIQGEEGSCSIDSDATGEADVMQEHEVELQANASEEARVQQEEEDDRRRVREEEEEQRQAQQQEEEEAQQREEEEQRRRDETSTEEE